MNDHLPEIPKIEESQDMIVPKGATGLDIFASKMGVRYNLLNNSSLIGTLQEGDIVTIVRLSDGSGLFIKNRVNIPVEGGKKTFTVALGKEVLYQNIESGPQEFPYIKFMRNRERNTYTIEGTDVEIPTKRLDAFKEELTKISGPFLTKCGSRKAQSDLACVIEKNSGQRGDISLDKKGIKGVFTSNTFININKLVSLTSTLQPADHPKSHIKLAEILARSLRMD